MKQNSYNTVVFHLQCSLLCPPFNWNSQDISNREAQLSLPLRVSVAFLKQGLVFCQNPEQSCFYHPMSKKSSEAIYWSWCLPDKPGKLCSLQTRSKNIFCWTGQWSVHSIAPCCLVPLECHQHLPWSKGTQKAQLSFMFATKKKRSREATLQAVYYVDNNT